MAAECTVRVTLRASRSATETIDDAARESVGSADAETGRIAAAVTAAASNPSWRR